MSATTPRTDDLLRKQQQVFSMQVCWAQMVDFARQLERELTAKTAECNLHHDTLCHLTSLLMPGHGCWTKDLLVAAIEELNRETRAAALEEAAEMAKGRMVFEGELRAKAASVREWKV